MANSLKGNTWILDTTGVITTNKLKVKSVEWLNPGSVLDTAVVKDRNGAIKASFTCEVAGQSQILLVENWWDGLSLYALGSGSVYVFLR